MPHQTSWPNVGPQTVPGPILTTVQYLLRADGHGVAVDGAYGPETRGAIQKLQADNGLAVDGIAGDQTWPCLIVTVSQGSTGDAVRAAQFELARRALPETAGLGVDGDFGPNTDAAVRAFQQLLSGTGLPQSPIDGVVGPNTWFALTTGFAIADI